MTEQRNSTDVCVIGATYVCLYLLQPQIGFVVSFHVNNVSSVWTLGSCAAQRCGLRLIIVLEAEATSQCRQVV